MRVIITGATGFLGRHLVNTFKSKGWSVIALGRNKEIGKSLLDNNVEFRAVELRALDQVMGVFEEVECVVHCAALSSSYGAESDFWEANVMATGNLVTASNAFNIRRFIYVSSTSVYFNFTDRLNINETDPVARRFANAYAKSKYAGEQMVLSQCNAEIVIIRPRGIVGKGDNAIMPRIFRVAANGSFPLISGGCATLDITYVKNVCDALYLAAITDGINGEIFNISNDEPMPLKQLLDQVFNKAGLSVQYRSLPYAAIRLLAGLMEGMSTLLSLKEPILTRYGVGLLAKSQTLDISKAKKRLGYHPVISIEEGLADYANWFKHNETI